MGVCRALPPRRQKSRGKAPFREEARRRPAGPAHAGCRRPPGGSQLLGLERREGAHRRPGKTIHRPRSGDRRRRQPSPAAAPGLCRRAGDPGESKGRLRGRHGATGRTHDQYRIAAAAARRGAGRERHPGAAGHPAGGAGRRPRQLAARRRAAGRDGHGSGSPLTPGRRHAADSRRQFPRRGRQGALPRRPQRQTGDARRRRCRVRRRLADRPLCRPGHRDLSRCCVGLRCQSGSAGRRRRHRDLRLPGAAAGRRGPSR